MPDRDGDYMYRIKSPLEEYERVVKEDLLVKSPGYLPEKAPARVSRHSSITLPTLPRRGRATWLAYKTTFLANTRRDAAIVAAGAAKWPYHLHSNRKYRHLQLVALRRSSRDWRGRSCNGL